MCCSLRTPSALLSFVLPALSLVEFPPLDSAVMANDINGTVDAAAAEPTDNVVPLEELAAKEPEPEPAAAEPPPAEAPEASRPSSCLRKASCGPPRL
jgi:hypothetical protein